MGAGVRTGRPRGPGRVASVSEELRVELLRRLTTLSADRGSSTVWDARVVDRRGHVASACDHGHATSADAEACGRAQLAVLSG